MNNKFLGEIVESSLNNFVAQSWDWQRPPSFGSVVIIDTKLRKLFAVVSFIQTSSIDQVRQPFAFKKTQEELIKEQPQIFEFLRTNFTCLMLGYVEENKVFSILPPEPPKIHEFVRIASQEEMYIFFNCSNYLQVLFGQVQNIFNIDELLIALLNNLKNQNLLNKNHFDEFIDIFLMINNNDYFKLKLFLKRLNL